MEGGGHRPILFHHPHVAGVGVGVLHQARSGVGVDPLDEVPIADVDLFSMEDGGDRDHQGEVGEVALEVVGHRDHRPLALARQHHLRRVVEELGPRLADVEAAEGVGGGG